MLHDGLLSRINQDSKSLSQFLFFNSRQESQSGKVSYQFSIIECVKSDQLQSPSLQGCCRIVNLQTTIIGSISQ